MRLVSSWQARIQFLVQWLVIITAFTLPLSTTATDWLFPTAAVLSLFTMNLREKWLRLKANPIALMAMAFFFLYLLGASYSIAPAHEISRQLQKAACLLFAALLIPTLLEERWRHYAINAFLCAMVLTLLLSYCKYFFMPNLFHTRFNEASVFKDHIIQNFLLAYALFIFIFRWMNQYPYRWVYAILALLTLYDILLMSTGRSGYFIFAALLIYTISTRLGWRGVIISLLSIAILFVTAYIVSSLFRERMTNIVMDIAQYQQGEQYTSVGIRFQSIKNAAILFKEKPLMGYGTGSFLTAYTTLPAENLTDGIMPVSYNDYLNVAVELGIPGLVLLLLLFFTQWRYSFQLSKELRFIAQTLVISMAIGCFANPWLSDTTELHLYALLLAVSFSALPCRYPAEKYVSIPFPQG